MRLVNGGAFTMGLDHPRAIPDEMAEHEVTVKSFYLDTTEVTNQAYQMCVDANVCRPPRDIDTRKPEADLAVYAGKVTKDVGSCPKGAGPYGHLDLAGNVWEWTADLLRGGAFNYFDWGLRASNRVHHPESWRLIMAGFRCAKDIP